MDKFSALGDPTRRSIVEMLAVSKREWLLKPLRDDEGGVEFWESTYHPVDASSDAFDQKLWYIHDNPVRRGFVKQPEHWYYSSARSYVLKEHIPIKTDRIWGEDAV